MSIHSPDIYSWIERSQPALKAVNQRMALIFSADKPWTLDSVKRLLERTTAEKQLIISSQIEDALEPNKAITQLGNEYELIIFDAHDGFDVDAFAAIAGTLRGGGIFILMFPDINQWQEYADSQFLKRALKLSQSHPSVFFIEQGKPLPEIMQPQVVTSISEEVGKPYATKDQQQVVDSIVNSVMGSKAVPIVVTSDRGRGKSSALGLAAGRLLQQGIKRIIVTAPRLTTSEPLFHHASRILPGAELTKKSLVDAQASINYWAYDALLEEKPGADLVLVDEAAAIPLPMLSAILDEYQHVVFSSTIHGYEGTGRGFALKFKQVLDEYNPDWTALSMRQPVRWAINDPVEHWVDQILCLDAELVDIPVNIIKDDCIVRQLAQEELVNDEEKLSSLFALLVEAHYRTRPSDLRYLLDEENIRIYSLEYNNQLIAALVINLEGGLTTELSSAIYRGERRPSGHLLAQTLTFHAGCEQAATLAFARIMRIAVHPALQGQGLGSYFLQQVLEQEKQYPVDIIGTSFAATVELLRFWQNAGFELVRMGFTRDHVSGVHSAVMAQPITTNGQSIFDDVKTRFRLNLKDWLLEPLKDLPEEMQAYLEKRVQPQGPDLTETDWQDIDSYTNSHRGYEACMGAIHKLVTACEKHLKKLDEQQQSLINARILNRQSWAETVRACGLTGKNEAQQGLKRAVAELAKNCN